MKRNLVVQVSSLLSILLASLHLVDDIVFGSEKSVASNLLIVVILAVWLYGTLALGERRSGQVIMLIGSLMGLIIFFVHLTGQGGLAGVQVGKLSGVFFYAWTLLALAVVALLSLVLSVQGVLSLRRPKVS